MRLFCAKFLGHLAVCGRSIWSEAFELRCEVRILRSFQHAGVAEWQTRWTQNPVIARSCGFNPLRRHCRSFPRNWHSSEGKSQPRKCPLECRNGCAGPEAPWRGRYRATETKDSHTKIPFSGEARTSDVIRRACRFNIFVYSV